MSSPDKDIQTRYNELIASIPLEEKDLDYTIMEKRIQYLEEIDRVSNSAVSVFDLFRKTHVYLSPSYKKRLGLPEDMLEGPDGFEHLMHPDDLFFVMEAGYYFLKRMVEQGSETLRDYKLYNEFRIPKPDSGWMRMTEQHQILETDSNGNIWLALSIVDVSPDQDETIPLRCRLVNQKTGDVFRFIPNNDPGLKFLKLSDREMEVMDLVATGLTSKEIAGKLFISVHTVNTHRQNIIEKMDVKNIAEAVRYIPQNGIGNQRTNL